MGTKKVFRLILSVIILLFLAGIILYPKLKPLLSKHNEDGPARGFAGMRGGMQKTFASGYVIVPQEMSELIISTGSLLPDEEVELSFETSGKVVGIFFEEGTRVKKGDLLAKINDRPLQGPVVKITGSAKAFKGKGVQATAVARPRCHQPRKLRPDFHRIAISGSRHYAD